MKAHIPFIWIFKSYETNQHIVELNMLYPLEPASYLINIYNDKIYNMQIFFPWL